MSVAQNEILTALARLHTEVSSELASSNQERSPLTTRNAKGDVQRPFDLMADSVVLRCLEREFGSGIVLSEESNSSRFGTGISTHRFVVEPVDGSDNWAQGLPLSSVSIAVLQVEGPIALNRVLYSLVGGVEAAFPTITIRGEGAFQGSKCLQVSGRRSIRDAFLSCELNHSIPSDPLASLLGQARAVRCYGCASLAVTLVASGALDAHIDVRGRLTPESFLAAALALEEAGGCLVGADGEPLGEFLSLSHRSKIIAAATPQLAQEIVDVLAGRPS